MKFDHELEKQDLQVFLKISRAFWMDEQQAYQALLDACTVVLWVEHLTGESAVIQIAVGLLYRIRRGDFFLQRTTEKIHPFYYLSFEERLALMGLQGGWSYVRLSAILGWTVEQFQEVLWKARLQFSVGFSIAVPYPVGIPMVSPSCPDYHEARPWTQVYLDHQVVSGMNRLFLQRHLLSCESCYAGFLRCQKLHYQVDKELSLLSFLKVSEKQIKILQNKLNRISWMLHPSVFYSILMLWRKSMITFLSQIQIQLVFLVWFVGVWLVLKLSL